ncbi:MAG: DHHA1 domain-containing protein, partial [Brevibacterium sp.]|nr:DHHA1 domain-containing protein [Brevibacterium sp.]
TTASSREEGHQAGKLVSLACGELGGGGGGKPDLAQGGGSDVSAIPSAIRAVKAALQ